MEAYLIDGMEIVVERQYSVTVIIDDEEERIITKAETVEALLEEQGIVLGDDDRITPELSTELSDGTEIVINRVSTKKIVEEEEIEYETEYEYTSSLYKGETKVKQEGENGIKEITYEVVYVDGEEESREVVKEEVTKEAVNRIILVGTKQKSTSSSGSSKTVVSKEAVYDCDGSGHGYYIIEYSDGTTEYEDF